MAWGGVGQRAPVYCETPHDLRHAGPLLRHAGSRWVALQCPLAAPAATTTHMTTTTAAATALGETSILFDEFPNLNAQLDVGNDRLRRQRLAGNGARVVGQQPILYRLALVRVAVCGYHRIFHQFELGEERKRQRGLA